MKPILTRLFAGLFLLLAAQASGQAPSVSISFVVTSPVGPLPFPIGTKFVVELRANHFTNIDYMQFPITYNKDAMKFDSISAPAFSNWNAGNFVSIPAAGKVGISWDGYSNGASMPFSFPNGTALFKMHFTVIGNGVLMVNVNSAAAPPALEIVGNGGTVGSITYQDGPLTVSAGEPGDLDLPLSLSPNPFLVEAQLNFELEETTDTQVFIADATGRIVFEKQFFQLSPGQHGMVIENGMLGAPGLYTLTLRAGRKIATHKFVTF